MAISPTSHRHSYLDEAATSRRHRRRELQVDPGGQKFQPGGNNGGFGKNGRRRIQRMAKKLEEFLKELDFFVWQSCLVSYGWTC